jgi:hypothetical protein
MSGPRTVSDAGRSMEEGPMTTLHQIALRGRASGRGRVTHAAYMRVQAALMPRGAELAWIERHSAAYRDWVESFARISDDDEPPTISEATLRRLARWSFVATPARAHAGAARRVSPLGGRRSVAQGAVV